ncbi:hypothetical protein Tco_0598490 [Tanacetum coccineum]
MTQALSSRIFTLELRDLPHKIDQTINEAVKEAVHIALQAPFRDHFSDLPEADMEEIIHQRKFKNDTYKSLPEHVALYETLEASMERANMEKFLAEKDKSQDTGNAHLPKIRTPATWLRPLPEEDRSKTPKPYWSIPPNDLPEPENNWANALATTYKDPEENKLLRKTCDIGSFIKWYCKRIGKKKLTKVDLEGPTFMTVKQFHTNNISLQFQMEECHWLLTGDKDRKNALSISKLKAARYLDFELEALVPLPWIESEHLQLDIESYQMKLNLTKPRWDASDFLFKEVYTIVSEPRAVIYRDRNDEKKMLQENEVHKFSDGTLTRVLDKLDHMVKDFRLYKYNKGMESRIWSKDDKRRSEAFMEVIERRLKIRSIFRSLESFASGRLRDVDYRLLTRME